MKTKIIGYMVEWFNLSGFEDFREPLSLRVDDKTPSCGVLDWSNGSAYVYATRQQAREVMSRTSHYIRAFDDWSIPDPSCCKIIPLRAEVKS